MSSIIYKSYIYDWKENISIESAHLKFADWATSGGTEYQDWYEDKSGYRNNTKIYQKL